MAKEKPPATGAGSRPGQYEKKLADYIARGANSKHAKEVTADIREMIDKIDLEGVHKERDSKVKGRARKTQLLSQGLTDDQLVDAYAGKPGQIPSAFKMKDLSEESIIFAYEVVTEPMVWLFRLPVLSAKRVKRFAQVFIQWAKTHIPLGLPLLDHAILVAAFFTPLAEAGKRKVKGEMPKYARKAKLPEHPDIPDGLDNRGDPFRDERAA